MISPELWEDLDQRHLDGCSIFPFPALHGWVTESDYRRVPDQESMPFSYHVSKCDRIDWGLTSSRYNQPP